MRVLLPLLLLVAAGCSGGSKIGKGEMACSNSANSADSFDVWRVHSGTDAVTVRVDTVDAETTFDPQVVVFSVSSWGSDIAGTTATAFIAEGDDEFPCTFPPAEYECPSASATGTDDVLVAVTGPIGFVGLIVPHWVRRGVGHAHARVLPFAFLAGGAFLALCDLLARRILAPADLPVGVLTAIVGGPFFLWLLLRREVGAR